MWSNTKEHSRGESWKHSACGSVLTSHSFGVISTILELVPIASLFFAFTNTVAAALWAADIEKGLVGADGTSPHLKEQIQKAQ